MLTSFKPIPTGIITPEVSATLNTALRRLSALTRIQTTPNIDFREVGGGYALRLVEQPSFPARIVEIGVDAHGHTFYGWLEMTPLPGGAWMKKDGGLVGELGGNPPFTAVYPAYEKNGNPNVPNGRMVEMYYAFGGNTTEVGQEFEFEYCCGNTSSSSSSSSSH